jgi:hypothetical protein
VPATPPSGCSDPPADGSDPFTTLLHAHGITVTPFPRRVYACADCGCLFAPDQGDRDVYPDRAIRTGTDGTPGCAEEDCPCHDLPHQLTPAVGPERKDR